jgi:hypothetical protein
MPHPPGNCAGLFEALANPSNPLLNRPLRLGRRALLIGLATVPAHAQVAGIGTVASFSILADTV